jgi:hypothetical protein
MVSVVEIFFCGIGRRDGFAGGVMRQLFAHAVGFFLLCIVLTARSSNADTLFVSVDDPSNPAAGVIDQISPGTAGSDITTFASGLTRPSGLAFSSTGTLYAATTNVTGRSVNIDAFSPAGSATTVVSGMAGDALHGLAFDSQGNLYVGLADQGVDKITPGGQVSPTSASYGQNVAIGPQGNLVSAATMSNELFNAATTSSASVSDNRINTPLGMAYDSQGNLYVANAVTDAIYKMTPSGQVSLFASLADSPDPFPAGAPVSFYGLAFDSLGILYVAESDGTTGAIGETDGGEIHTDLMLNGIPEFMANYPSSVAQAAVAAPLPSAAAGALVCLAAVAAARMSKSKTKS